MNFTKSELLLIFLSLSRRLEDNPERKPSQEMIELMNKISDELTK